MRFTIGKKLSLSFGVILLALGVVYLFALFSIRHMYEKASLIHQLSLALNESNEIRNLTMGILIVNNDVMHGNREKKSEFNLLRFEFESAIKNARAVDGLKAYESGLSALEKRMDGLSALLENVGDEGGAGEELLRESSDLGSDMVSVAEATYESVKNELDRAERDAQSIANRTFLWTLICSTGAVLIAVVSLYWVARSMRTPLLELTHASHEIARGVLSHRVAIRSQDEIGALGRDFNQMAESLYLSQKKIQESQQQLLQARKLEAVGQLAAGIAHEINTPMQYIGDNIRFLRHSCPNLFELMRNWEGLALEGALSTPAGEALQKIKADYEKFDVDFLGSEIPKALEQSQDGIEHVSKIVAAMKEYSHPGFKSKTFSDLNHGIENAILLSRNEWKYVADVKTDLDRALPHVLCFPNEMNQVFLNLIVNAAHAIADKNEKTPGVITIRSRCQGGIVEFDVEDTGTGIPEDIQGRIFDPFFTTKDIGRGTGQGLSVAYSVVTKQHGGEIAFVTRPGHGTTFTLRLPVNGSAGTESDGANARNGSGSGR
jgi:signal transduction histidine kinase